MFSCLVWLNVSKLISSDVVFVVQEGKGKKGKKGKKKGKDKKEKKGKKKGKKGKGKGNEVC